ncbi:MAG TPA: hypothetical protein VLL52_04730 [Anaerolineae bacterium]|nr:hypothetical protein [Anaerolineae bacterium]
MRQRDIFFFWLPLLASWLLMTTEGPFVSATINRLPDETIMLAAQGIVISLSVFIEAPIINMLATATALVKDRQAYDMVKRFTIHWMIILTIITALVGFVPPVFNLVIHVGLGIDETISQWVRPGMQIMLLWSAAIAWRRFLQGVLIQFKRTNFMAYGTAVRLAATIGAAAYVAYGTDLPGIYVGACGLMSGVIAEALFATWATRPLFKKELAPLTTEPENPLTYQDLFWFHIPLAASSVLVLMLQPVITFALARLDQPLLTLAAWPVIFQLMLLARAPALALPEAVIALTTSPETYNPIRRFTFTLTILSALAMLFFAITPLSNFYIFGIQDMNDNVGTLALNTIPYFIFFPALSILVFWIRGLLISQRATRDVNLATALNLGLTIICLAIGLLVQAPGLITAAITLNLATIGELIFLAYQVQKRLNYPIWSFRQYDLTQNPSNS